jgi:hypothetical protein
MDQQSIFALIRKALKAIGLSSGAVDDIIERITDFLSDKREKSPEGPKYSYALSSNVLTTAEHNFYSGQAVA